MPEEMFSLFLMDYQQIPFPDAVKLLADRYNIPITVEKDNEANDLFSSLYMLHEIALDLYQENLFSSSGKESFMYLLDRGLSIDMIKHNLKLVMPRTVGTN